MNDVDMDLRYMGVQRWRRRVWDRTDWAPNTRRAKAKLKSSHAKEEDDDKFN